MKKETFIQARARLFSELPALGYKVVTYNMGRTLKSPYVIDYHGDRYTFSAQAVHAEGGLSLWLDIRNLPTVEFDDVIKRRTLASHSR
jgi:hypothetical protein